MDKFVSKTYHSSRSEETHFEGDYYGILEISRHANAKEVREAYYRLKNTYDSSNQALYSLLDDEDLHDSLAEINKAYAILSHPGQKAEYDRSLESGENQLNPFCEPENTLPPKSTLNSRPERSLNRTKDQVEFDRDYEKPRTGLQADYTPSRSERKIEGAKTISPSRDRQVSEMSDGLVHFSQGAVSPSLSRHVARRAIALEAISSDTQAKISAMIADGDVGDGALFRRLRQLVGVSKEQMQDHIKISIGYIINLEENRFDQLPQAVYVKGFLKSYLRFLGVPNCERLVTAYAERFDDWTKNKST